MKKFRPIRMLRKAGIINWKEAKVMGTWPAIKIYQLYKINEAKIFEVNK